MTGHAMTAIDRAAGPNRFADAETPLEVLQQLAGAASVCWHGGTGDAVFNGELAAECADDAMERLIEIGRAGAVRSDADQAVLDAAGVWAEVDPYDTGRNVWRKMAERLAVDLFVAVRARREQP